MMKSSLTPRNRSSSRWVVVTVLLLASAATVSSQFAYAGAGSLPTEETVECIEEEAQVDYFDIEVTIQPHVHPTDCKAADTVMLGHDINLAIHDYGIDIAEEYDNVVFAGSVCPQPTITSGRRELVTLSPNKFHFPGSGGCGYVCPPDDFDRRQFLRRKLQGGNQWFLNTFKPHMEQTLTNHIMTEVVPKYEGCLGANPTVTVIVEGKAYQDLQSPCDNQYSSGLEFLRTYNLASNILRSSELSKCGMCTKIDFSTRGNGQKLNGGDYVRWAWNEQFEVKAIPNSSTWNGGYAPDQKARIYDSGRYGGLDPDMQSPNSKCPGGGPGEGIGGEPGSPGQNCVPAGNVLIIQQLDQAEPDDYAEGGTIRFIFNEPVFFSDIGLMDIDETTQKIKFYYEGGATQTYTYEGLGENGVQRVMANKLGVKQLDVVFPNSGGITEINFCPMCLD